MSEQTIGFNELPEEYNPYSIGSNTHHEFWADAVADEVEANAKSEPIVIKGGISPSGIPHLGNANEIVLGYLVAEVLRERGYEVNQVFTADDRDPLRGLPRKLADLDGNIVGLGDVDAGALGRNLGKPYTDIPDPFGCCDSYGAHFSNLIRDIATDLDIPIELKSNTELYESGEFEGLTTDLLRNQSTASAVLSKYQDTVGDDYIPFNPICTNCGKITETVTSIDIEAQTVEYECTDIEAGDQIIEGCGHVGEVSIRDGKLPWRFEWVAQWNLLNVDFEPFGKDHAEGSWPSGVDIAKNVFDFEPPTPMVYEWFTLEDKPFSSSEGHIVLVSEVLELIEPEVLLYFFAKDPTKARDFSIERLDQLVNEFDRIERIALGKQDAEEDEKAYAKRVYPFLVDTVEEDRIRIPYTFAAVLGMTDDQEMREEVARRQGHIPEDAPDWAVEDALTRVERARQWAERTNNEYNYELKRESMPEVDIDEKTAVALDELAAFIETHDDPDAIQGAIFEIARDHDIEVGDFFTTGYQLFFGLEEGPKLGHFLAKLDKQFVLKRLRREE
ncbi:lysine--tRNA ligase [Salinarchaeum sp. IM2453]|uniref:lysine--tRNA ligase n=1 Tax=Salinarchaeum sp. IM2453 TaxID=2862870 RepID=UPI001C83A7A1|nr:lysine--tRNA ligase [Salinarchaeum sp. IM2453]QZA89269.1 lysine--tRNA ligase [Salinarchaeum sp. IM2453]